MVKWTRMIGLTYIDPSINTTKKMIKIPIVLIDISIIVIKFSR